MTTHNNTFKNKDIVNIICVTYNAMPHIEKCLKSIFDQKYPYIELIIIDGNSTDGTKELLQKWNDKISFWKSEPDKGIYDAMNKALPHINGKWVYFIGADDELLPDFSSFVENELKDERTICYASIMIKGEVQKGKLTPYQRTKHGGVLHQSMIYPASVFKKYTYDLKYKIASDVALNITLNGDKDYNGFKYCDYVIAKFSATGVSSVYKDTAFYNDLPKLVLKNYGFSVWCRHKFRKIKEFVKGKKSDKRTRI